MMAVYVTHDIREALLLSDRVYVLSTRPTQIRQTVLLHAPPGQRQHNGGLTPELRTIEAEIIATLQAESREQQAVEQTEIASGYDGWYALALGGR